MIRNCSSKVVFASLLAFAGLAWSIPAGAVLLNVPAVGMIPKDGAPLLSETSGLLDANGEIGVYLAPLNIPAGQVVCNFELWSRDFDELDMTARLMRKRMIAATNNGFGPAAETMAEVFSSGSVDGIQKRTTNDIGAPTVVATYIYWVEIEFTGGFYQALATRVIYKTAC